MSESRFDVAVVGAGPNGLTAGAYLARAGARVIVLERRFERGGTLTSDDYSTPFLYNQAQMLLPLGRELPPYADLELADESVTFIEPAVPFAVTRSDGSTETLRRGGIGLGRDLEGAFDAASRAVLPLLYARPEPLEDVLRRVAESEPGAGRLAGLSPDRLAGTLENQDHALIVRYACGLAGFPDGDEPLGLIGAFCLARLFSPTLVAGGSKSLVNGLFRAAVRAGARCRVSTDVQAVEPLGDAYRLVCRDGQRFSARAVISTLDPLTTFCELLPAHAVGPELAAAMSKWEFDATGPFTAHFGIKGRPPAPVAGPATDALVRIVGFDSAAAVAAHFGAARRGTLRDRPAGHFTTTTHHDPLQASPGPYGPLHTLRFESLAPYELPDRSWDRHRRAYRAACWDLIRSVAPELEQARLLFEFADSPRDLERRFATARRGSVRQGSLHPAQTFTNRPHPSCASTRTPLAGFYLGGGGVHPGVPGTLAGGYNAAGAVCADLGLERWWPTNREGAVHA